MPGERHIFCGSAAGSTTVELAPDRRTLRLPIGRGALDVHLRYEHVHRPLVSPLSAEAEDLLELATFVYCADGAISRGDPDAFEYGAQWRRPLHFKVPVRCAALWSRSELKSALIDVLTFLSDDGYEFDFLPGAPSNDPGYLGFGAPAPTKDPIEEVVLFSGGLDSLGGAVQECLQGRRKVALVSHTSTPKGRGPVLDLYSDLIERIDDRRVIPLHVPVTINKGKPLGREHTYRTRSFLYAALGAVVAQTLGLNRIRFYENGVISFNLPLCGQLVGARASRSTHPRALKLMARLFSLVFQCDFRVENPFLWKTKTDILSELRSANHGALCARTISCTHTLGRKKDRNHCGICSQCIDRRITAIAAGLSESEEPVEHYERDLLRDPLDDQARTIVDRYIGSARRITKFAGPPEFLTQYGEVTDALPWLDCPHAEGLRRVFQLHQRHAVQVQDAVERVVAEAAGDIAAGRIGTGGLLGVVLREHAGGAQVPLQVEPTERVRDLPPPGVRAGHPWADAATFRVHHGDKACFLGNKMEFKLFQRLARSPGSFISQAQLRQDVWGGAIRGKTTVAKVASNLRRLLRECGMTRIEIDGSQRDHYCLRVLT